MNKVFVRCEGIARDARLKGRADLCGTAANPAEGEQPFRPKLPMRCKGIACDARPRARADLCGASAKPG
jgi:hypothetical protein